MVRRRAALHAGFRATTGKRLSSLAPRTNANFHTNKGSYCLATHCVFYVSITSNSLPEAATASKIAIYGSSINCVAAKSGSAIIASAITTVPTGYANISRLLAMQASLFNSVS